MTFRKTLILCIILAIALPTTAHAGWWRTYGDEDNERGDCVQITSDGNYIISGRNDGNLWLLKVDTSGNALWEHTYGSSKGTKTRWVEETSDGGYIVASWTPSLLKVDDQGDTLWSEEFDIYTYCVQLTSDGGYIVTGGSHGNDYDEYLMMVKTDSEGDTLWTRTYIEPDHNRNSGSLVQVTNDGGYIITGLTGYADEYIEWCNLWLVKIDTNGSKLWSKIYGDDNSKGYSVRQTSDGGYIVTGLNPGGLWLLKTDAQGDTIWTRTYNTSTGGTGFSVQQTQDNGYILVGVTETFTTSLNVGTAKLWFLKTDSLGDTLWTRVYEGDGYDVGRCVQQTSDLGYIIVGYTSSHGAGGSDVYLLRTDSLGLLGITENPLPEVTRTWEVVSSLGSQIILKYHSYPQGFTAQIFDASGRRIDKLYATESSGSITWGQGYALGVYFIRVADNLNQKSTIKVVLIH